MNGILWHSFQVNGYLNLQDIIPKLCLNFNYLGMAFLVMACPLCSQPLHSRAWIECRKCLNQWLIRILAKVPTHYLNQWWSGAVSGICAIEPQCVNADKSLRCIFLERRYYIFVMKSYWFFCRDLIDNKSSFKKKKTPPKKNKKKQQQQKTNKQ